MLKKMIQISIKLWHKCLKTNTQNEHIKIDTMKKVRILYIIQKSNERNNEAAFWLGKRK